MFKESFGHEPDLQIETLKGWEGSEVSVCPERGGIITSININGEEILRQDPNQFKSGKIRGGIPIMFPNAGPDGEGLPQHGFARDANWKVVTENEIELIEILESNKETQEVFPYDFRLEMTIRPEQDGSISLIQKVLNKSDKSDMPISMGLHPYFQVAEERKKRFLLDLIGKERANKHFWEWLHGEPISIDNPGALRLPLSEKGALVMKISEEYKTVWIWTQPGKEQDFVCVEPVMGDVGSLRNNPTLVKPQAPLFAWVNFSRER